MTFVSIVLLLGFVLILPLAASSVYAENSWSVFLNPFDGDQKDELFVPLELPISLGDTVTWINQDSTSHKIVSGVPVHPDYSGEFFSSDILSPGDSFSETFDEDVQYTAYYYFCEIHPWFTGKLFFEDRETILHSTIDISYDVVDSESLQFNGLVESDLATTGYEVLIYDSKNDLIFHKLSSFESDASFDFSIDISSSMWGSDDDYLLKLVYGVPSESTELPFNLRPESFISNSNTFENIFGQMMSQVNDWMSSILGFEK
jgi:plastocyanin